MTISRTESNRQYYITQSSRDEEWGISVSTIGKQIICPQSIYPPHNHPNNYHFHPSKGRVLNEYQLIYITKGSGYFESNNYPLQKIKSGDVILLFPNEWHNYYPDQKTGWEELWVGFKGPYIDQRVESGFFTKEKPIYSIGISHILNNLYEDILQYSAQEEAGYQQIVSGIVLHMLGLIYYYERNNNFTNSNIVDKINEARLLMKENASNPLQTQDIAKRLGMGYTWFRRTFKDYTGVSPAQYQMQQRLILSKELLMTTNLNIVEIAYRLNFETGSQFTTFFKNKEGITPSEYRKK